MYSVLSDGNAHMSAPSQTEPSSSHGNGFSGGRPTLVPR